MGNTYTVLVWRVAIKGYRHDEVYRGESFFKAMYVLIGAKMQGIGCATLEWR